MGYKSKVAASRGHKLKSSKGTPSPGKLQRIPNKFIDKSKEEYEQQHTFLRRHLNYIILVIILGILSYVAFDVQGVVESMNYAIAERNILNNFQHHGDEKRNGSVNTYFYQVAIKSLSVNQIENRLNLICYNIDLNQDRELDETELKEWAYESYRLYAQTKSNQEFARMDTNSDGFVSWSEISSSFIKINDQNEVGLTFCEDVHCEEERKTLEDFDVCFLIADLNQDLLLNPLEFNTCSQPEEANTATRLALYRKSKLMKAGKGLGLKELLSPEKFWIIIEDMKIRYGQNSEEYQIYMNIYKRVDSNSNGVIEEEEMMNLAFPSNKELADEHVADLIITLDLDHNRKLNGNEILQNPLELLNSKFTRYGRDLMEFNFDDA